VKNKEEGNKEGKDRYQKRKRKKDLDFEKPKSIKHLAFRHGNQKFSQVLKFSFGLNSLLAL
jgi:hypothetical protein